MLQMLIIIKALNFIFFIVILRLISHTMQFSDDQKMPMDEQIQPFRMIIPKKRVPGGHGKFEPTKQSLLIKQQCQKLMFDIINTKLDKKTQKISEVLKQNMYHNKSLIIALNFKRNQQNNLLIFQQKFTKFINDLFKQRTSRYHKVNVISISKQDVKDIALQIQIEQDKKLQKLLQERQKNPTQKQKYDPKKHMNIYFIRKITNLKQSNIRIFQKNVIDAIYSVILPTYQSLNIADNQVFVDQSQKYYYQIYNNKDIFCQFLYRCVVSRTIMAYLPKQILTIIDLYDYYPISIQQGCNMIIYALQIYAEKSQIQNKPPKKALEMKQLFRTFNKVWKKYWPNEQQVQRVNYQKFTRLILDESNIYTVNQNKIKNSNTLSNYGNDEQLNIYEQAIQKFKQKLAKDESLSYLLKYFEQLEQNNKKVSIIKKKKNRRQQQLGFLNSSSLKSQKQLFQDKISKFFHLATQPVRAQASLIPWSSFQLYQTLNPQLMRNIVQGILQQPEYRDVFNFIRSNATMPMARIIGNFKNMEIGKLIYIIRCLELKGMVETNKNTLKPSLTTNYYEKSYYQLSRN